MRRARRDAYDVLVARTPTHAHLRDRIAAVVVFTLVLDAVGTVLAMVFEHRARGSEIRNLGEAWFWTTTQLLTVPSSLKNPLTPEARVLDVVLEAYAIGVVATLAWVFALFLADFFDTMGTLVGVGRQAGYLTKDGELPGIRKPLLVDSVAAMAGGFSSASSATTYIESGAGVGVGGRTGWVSVVTGALFFPFMFFAPIIGMVLAQATGAALVIVGYLMVTVLSEYEEEAETGTRVARAGIDFNNLALGFGAMLAIVIMPFTYSITNGIGFGFIAYVLIRIAQGDWRKIDPLMYAVAGLFTLYFLIPVLQDNLSWI